MQAEVGSERQMEACMAQSIHLANSHPVGPRDEKLFHTKTKSLQRQGDSQSCSSEVGKSRTRLEVLWGLRAEQGSQWEHFHHPDGLKRTQAEDLRGKKKCDPVCAFARKADESSLCLDSVGTQSLQNRLLRSRFALGLSNCAQAMVLVKLDKKRLDKYPVSHV